MTVISSAKNKPHLPSHTHIKSKPIALTQHHQNFSSPLSTPYISPLALIIHAFPRDFLSSLIISPQAASQPKQFFAPRSRMPHNFSALHIIYSPVWTQTASRKGAVRLLTFFSPLYTRSSKDLIGQTGRRRRRAEFTTRKNDRRDAFECVYIEERVMDLVENRFSSFSSSFSSSSLYARIAFIMHVRPRKGLRGT